MEKTTTPETSDFLPTDPSGLRAAGAAELLELADGERYEIRIGPVAKRVGGELVRPLAYNGSVPGDDVQLPRRPLTPGATGFPTRRRSA